MMQIEGNNQVKSNWRRKLRRKFRKFVASNLDASSGPEVSLTQLIRKKIKNGLCEIYNPRGHLIFNRTPVKFIKVCMLFLGFYIFLTALTAAEILISEQTVAVPWRNSHPSNHKIITEAPAIFPAITMLNYSIKKYDCKNVSTYESYRDAIDKLLSSYQNSNQTCPETYNRDQELCRFDTLLLGECAKPPYGFDVGKPCLYLRLAKIFHFNPEGELSTDYVSISCKTYDNKTWIDIPTFPQGFLRNLLPYTVEKQQPILAVRGNSLIGDNVYCELKAKKVVTSNEYELGYAVGKIKLNMHKIDNPSC